MTNLAILPIILPLFAGIVLAFTNKNVGLSRSLAKVFALTYLVITVFIAYLVYKDGSIILETGDWSAPYGIIFIADVFSITLVLTTSILLTAIIYYATRTVSEKKERHYFYALIFFLISGVSGAFLTGDLFNLFVFFEVLLMASYGLITLGGGKEQLRESLKYVLINLFSSIVFVTTVAFLYSVVGTVNMAHIAQRVHEVEQEGILTAIGIILFFVFATKAALFPLYYWMPKSYVVPNTVVSSLFGALLTKVGIYSIIRVFTLIFTFETGITHTLFLWIAGLSMIFGVIGALSTNDIKLIVAYNVIPSIGFVLYGLAIFNQTALTGSIYYLVHDMIIKAALFLIVGVVAYVAGTTDLKKMGGLMHKYPLLAWTLFVSAFILAGIPPFSGFIGKVFLLKGSFEADEVVMMVIALLTSLLVLYSVLKIFIRGFWGTDDKSLEKRSTKGLLTPIFFLLSISVILGLGAELFVPQAELISEYLLNPEIYIDSVLKE